MKITLEQFKRMIPTNKEPEVWYAIATNLFPRYDINTRNRVAGFMAQCGHESADFSILRENLNYSWQALRRTFPRYFPTDESARKYERRPELIANIVYNDANRSERGKLGNVKTGDGWRFIGRGIKQITGRNNYTRFGASVNMTAEEAAIYCETRQGAFESACWFWNVNNLNPIADANDIRKMTLVINGGLNGLADRETRYKRILAGLEKDDTELAGNEIPGHTTLRIGDRGDLVKRVQLRLSLSADGIFGSGTEAVVRSWQRINKYATDGILTKEQIEKILSN
jgi:putative chitinase